MGSKYAREICSASGVLKVVESALVFAMILVHRFGDNGEYVFFGTTAHFMVQGDPLKDTENLGNGCLITWAIICPTLLISYCLDGRHAVQSLFLEMASDNTTLADRGSPPMMGRDPKKKWLLRAPPPTFHLVQSGFPQCSLSLKVGRGPKKKVENLYALRRWIHIC